MYGKVVTVRHQAVTRKKDNRFAVALDSEQNNIHVKDIVKVIDGPHSVSISFVPSVTAERFGMERGHELTVLPPSRAGNQFSKKFPVQENKLTKKLIPNHRTI